MQSASDYLEISRPDVQFGLRPALFVFTPSCLCRDTAGRRTAGCGCWWPACPSCGAPPPSASAGWRRTRRPPAPPSSATPAAAPRYCTALYYCTVLWSAGPAVPARHLRHPGLHRHLQTDIGLQLVHCR